MKRLLGSVVAGVSALTLSGCTLIGFLAGKSEDHKRARPQPVAREQIDTLKLGQPIEVQLWDGTRLSGRYQGLRWVPEEEYARAYEAARAGGGLAAQLPALGPGADLVTKTGRATKGELRGIAPGFLAMREKSSSPQRLVELDQVARLSDAAGHRLRGEELRTLAEERRVPSVMQLVLEQPAGNRTLELGQVASVALPAQPGGRWKKGLLIGLAVDALVVTVVAISVSQMEMFGDTNTTYTSSCPLVDSFDGRAWRLDAEPLGGAFYPAAERTDVARLEHLVETEGEYRLRLRNDQQEIDHVDALALRVVDHPPGTEVVPDQHGRLHVLHGEERPRAAQVLSSGQGSRPSATLAALLSRADGEMWASDLPARDATAAPDPRDGLELAFQRPPGASSAVLVARVGATALGGRLLAQVLALHGRDLGLFYAGLARDPQARARFERAREREVLPTVRVWDGRRWQAAGFLRDLPSLVQRDQAVPLDLRGIEGATLRLRIDGPPGLWSIDRAVVAFATGEDFEETRLFPSRATREDGRDATDVLGSIDGRRHSLRPHQDSVTLSFVAPPVRRGRERTVLVEATGHYGVIVAAEGEPQREAFRRLVDEPGAVARFAREHLRESPRAPGS